MAAGGAVSEVLTILGGSGGRHDNYVGCFSVSGTSGFLDLWRLEYVGRSLLEFAYLI